MYKVNVGCENNVFMIALHMTRVGWQRVGLEEGVVEVVLNVLINFCRASPVSETKKKFHAVASREATARPVENDHKIK